MRLGADPEVFMTNVNGQLVSAIGRVPGTKWEPFQLKDMPEGFTIQQDNVALEFGIPPADSKEQYVSHIKSVRNAGLTFLKNVQFSPLSCAIFPDEEMRHPAAHQFGCEPDFNAWTGKMNHKPEPPHPFMRSAGGHVHVETKLPKKPVVQAMDLFLSVPAVLMDKGEERKKLYGTAGAHRPKPYGVEYRTLSNFWIFDDVLIEWVWRNTERALDSVRKRIRYNDIGGVIVSCINNNDKPLAKQLIKEYQLDACY